MVIGFIVACEVLFWVLVLGGLVARYLLRLRRLSTVLLLLVPVLDVALLVAIALHLRSGASADITHGIGAGYLGFTVAFGHSVVRWADARFAHRFAGGPPPPRPPRGGWARTRHEWVFWLRIVLACVIAAGAMVAITVYVDDPARTAAFAGMYARLGLVVGVAALWPVSHTLWPGRPERPDSREGRAAERR